jgi:hypothetical protein
VEEADIGMVTLLDRDAILVKSKNSRIAVSTPRNGHTMDNLGLRTSPAPPARLGLDRRGDRGEECPIS